MWPRHPGSQQASPPLYRLLTPGLPDYLYAVMEGRDTAWVCYPGMGIVARVQADDTFAIRYEGWGLSYLTTDPVAAPLAVEVLYAEARAGSLPAQHHGTVKRPVRRSHRWSPRATPAKRMSVPDYVDALIDPQEGVFARLLRQACAPLRARLAPGTPMRWESLVLSHIGEGLSYAPWPTFHPASVDLRVVEDAAGGLSLSVRPALAGDLYYGPGPRWEMRVAVPSHPRDTALAPSPLFRLARGLRAYQASFAALQAQPHRAVLTMTGDPQEKIDRYLEANPPPQALLADIDVRGLLAHYSPSTPWLQMQRLPERLPMMFASPTGNPATLELADRPRGSGEA